MGHICSIYIMFILQAAESSTNRFRKETSYASGCALEESYYIGKLPAPIMQTDPMHQEHIPMKRKYSLIWTFFF